MNGSKGRKLIVRVSGAIAVLIGTLALAGLGNAAPEAGSSEARASQPVHVRLAEELSSSDYGVRVRATEEAVTLANRGGGRPPAPPRRKPIQMPGLQEVAERLSGAFDTRVRVSLGKRKGKIVVEVGSVEDLQRIVALMDSKTGR